MNTLHSTPIDSRYFAHYDYRQYKPKPSAIGEIMPTDNRTALLDLIATLSFKLGDFTLASGQKSDYYIDCRITTLHAEGGRLSGLLLYNLIRDQVPSPETIEAVGGLTMGAA